MEHNISIILMQTPWIIAAIILGIIACIGIYKGDYRSFFKSSVFIKTIMWLPLYLGFCLTSYSFISASIAGLLIIAAALYEWRRHGKVSVVGYLIYFLIGCIAWPLSVHFLGSNPWVAIVLSSVLSDVGAFFFGKVLGKHHLPAFLNNRKSYEGVVGQIVGGVIGVLITSVLFDVTIAWWWGLAIGILSATGDLANSFTKRRLRIDDWGNTIPGHGGVMDRFSSLNAVLIGVALLFSITLL